MPMALDSKSSASTSSATSAYCFVTDKTHYNTSMVGLSIVKWKKYKKVDKKIKKWKNKLINMLGGMNYDDDAESFWKQFV